MPLIIGVDPGSRHTGYGIIHAEKSTQTCVVFGVIHCPLKQSMSERLLFIYEQLSTIIQTYRPNEAVIEEVFVQKNVQSALKLGQARGSAMVALAQHALPVAQYTPRQIKQSIVGYGGADKHQMQHMVRHLLRLTTTPTTDAADALAIAICHHHHQNLRSLIHDRTTARNTA